MTTMSIKMQNSKKAFLEQDTKFDENVEKQIQTLSLQIQEDNVKISSKLDDQYKKISSFTESYDERLERISARNKVSTNIETTKK